MNDVSSSALADRIQALEDVAAIKDVQLAYWHSIDLKQPDDFRDIFATGEINITFPGATPMRDREELISMVKQYGMSPTYQGNHLGLAPKIRLTGADTASGNWRVLMIAYDFDQKSISRMTGEYNSEYVRTAEGWRISSMIVSQHSWFVESAGATGELSASSFAPIGG